MTTRALARLHVPCILHASPLLPRRASAVPVESQGPRTHTTQPPPQSTTDHHRPMTSFTLPSNHWAPVQSACHSLFPLLNRLLFPGSLHRSPSIQLDLQHDSMVVVRATPRPVDFKLHVYTTLNQPRAIVLSKPHKPPRLVSRVSTPRSWSPSASRTYVVVTDCTTVFCTNRLASIPSDCLV